nr:T9SS type A sorting domain-containing protein [uncultured Carboxylicivirga sp.]
MKRFTLLLLGACLFSFSTIAQFAPTSDVFAPITKAGAITDVAKYGTGLVFVSTTETNDVISFTTDGSSFTDVETLITGTTKALYGWSDSEIAFYLGESETDGLGKELRKLESGTAAAIKDHEEEYDPEKGGLVKGVLTSVGRYFNNDLGAYDYHYFYQSNVGGLGTAVIKPSVYETATGDIYSMQAPGNFSIPYIQTQTGHFNGVAFNGSYYYTGGVPSGWGAAQALFEVDYDNYTLIQRFVADDDLLGLYSFKATNNRMFFLQGMNDWADARLFYMDTDGLVESLMINGMDVMVDDAVPMHVFNNKLYAVVEDKLTSIAWDMDYATTSWGWVIKKYHINAEGESDNITGLAVSGDNIFVLAAKSGGEAELFALNPNEGEYVSAMPDNIAPSDAFHSLTAIEGGVAFLGNNGTSDVVYVSDGNDGNTKQLLFEGQPTLSINEMYSAGGKVYMFAENGTDTDIYQYSPSFATQAVTVTILDEATSEPIQYVNVVFNTGLMRYSGTTDENGQVIIENVPNGYLNVTVDASGSSMPYVGVNQEYYVGAYTTEVTYSLQTGKQFMITVLDANTSSEVYDVTLTFVDQTDESEYSTTIGYNNFTNMVTGNTPILPLGTYTVTIVCDGYDTYTETDFLVDDNISSVSFTISEISTGMDKTKDNGISIYPNPASDVINITTDKEIVSVDVIAINGAKVKQVTRGDITQINISDLAKGIYIVVTTDVNGAKAWTKVNKL